MPAPDHAITLLELNENWKYSQLRYYCTGCSHMGPASELLCVDEERTLWCGKCRTANTKWEEWK